MRNKKWSKLPAEILLEKLKRKNGNILAIKDKEEIRRKRISVSNVKL
jgi:hypothetical protein